jgi:hypothetical protein
MAQEERPQITPGERKVPRKKDASPRALGVLQVADNGKATLIPVFILIDGKFYDATDYKADPVPMALESGIVYEGTRTGNSLGLFTVSSALHSKAPNSPSPWIATGTWVPVGAEVAKTTHAAEAVPVGIDASDGPPRLTRAPATTPKDSPASAPPPANAGSPPSTPGSSSSGSPASASPPQNAPASSDPQKAPESKPTEAKPTESKPAESKPAPPANDSGADASQRPRLRRGVPTQPLPEDEVPGYSKPGSVSAPTPGKPESSAPITASAAAKGPIQLVPAVSDASGTELHSYTFDWLKDEESDRRKQMMDLAKTQLRAYLAVREKGSITPQPSPGVRRSSAKKPPPEPVFGNVQMITYDLWRANQPILVFTADAQVQPSPGTPASADSDLHYSITLVTRTDIYGNLHTLYSGVTDKYHLDLTPRLELVDAVDADGDGRGELLFRETSDAGTGWIVYRATADKLWKMFDSLNPR